MYYSSRLQEAWANYKQGNYDDYLLEGEKSSYMPTMPIPQTFEKIAIYYAQTKNQRLKNDAEIKQKRKQSQLDEENRLHQEKLAAEAKQQKLKESEQAYNERQAKEAQQFSHEDKVIGQKRERIMNALKEACNHKQKFIQEEYAKKDLLLAKQNELEQELFEEERMHNSRHEDMIARQNRINNKQSELAELEIMATQLELEQKDNPSVENTRAFIAAQDTIRQLKQTIKNMEDDFLTFERNMNIYEQRANNLKSEINHIAEQIQTINIKESRLDKIIMDLELEELEFLSDIAKSNSTTYIKGDDAELPFITQKRLDNAGIYQYTHFNQNQKEVSDE